jgi:hypothetical protein
MIIFPGAKPSFFTDATAAAAIVSATLFNISHTNCTPLIKTSPATKFLFLLFLSTQNKAPSDLRPKGQKTNSNTALINPALKSKRRTTSTPGLT